MSTTLDSITYIFQLQEAQREKYCTQSYSITHCRLYRNTLTAVTLSSVLRTHNICHHCCKLFPTRFICKEIVVASINACLMLQPKEASDVTKKKRNFPVIITKQTLTVFQICKQFHICSHDLSV